MIQILANSDASSSFSPVQYIFKKSSSESRLQTGRPPPPTSILLKGTSQVTITEVTVRFTGLV